MSQLMIRPSHNDHRVLGRLLSGPAIGAGPVLGGIVLDAPLAAREPSYGRHASTAGIALAIDPLTHLVQSTQPIEDSWARLRIAPARALDPRELCAGSPELRALVKHTIDFQVDHGATAVIPPYVLVGAAGDGWLDAQLALLDATAEYLRSSGSGLPVWCVLALSWRLLPRTTWPAVLSPLLAATQRLDPAYVGLAATKVADGVRPADRLAALLAVSARVGRHHRVLGWRQGRVGEAMVADGAAGYETGIGWRETCDLRAEMRTHQRLSSGGGGQRPRYVASLRRGVNPLLLSRQAGRRDVVGHVVCPDARCCSDGRQVLLGDARAHAVISRVRQLRELGSIDAPRWRWAHLAPRLRDGLDLGRRINRRERMAGLGAGVGLAHLEATYAVAELRRQSRGHVA